MFFNFFFTSFNFFFTSLLPSPQSFPPSTFHPFQKIFPSAPFPLCFLLPLSSFASSLFYSSTILFFHGFLLFFTKRKECSPTLFEGEGSSVGSVQYEVQEALNRPVFPLWNPWYTPSLFFPQVIHSNAPPISTCLGVSCQLGFANST